MRKIHIAQGVENLEEAIAFYNRIFYDITPTIGDIELGTGRIVNGAEWRSKYVYLVIFEGHEKSGIPGLDHLGVIFDNKDDLKKCLETFQEYDATPNSMSTSQWVMDSSGNICWELFLNVVPDVEKNFASELASNLKSRLNDMNEWDDKCVKEHSKNHLLWMCDQIIENFLDWPEHKSHRWIGYVQGIMTVYGDTDVDSERKITKEIVDG